MTELYIVSLGDKNVRENIGIVSSLADARDLAKAYMQRYHFEDTDIDCYCYFATQHFVLGVLGNLSTDGVLELDLTQV